MQNIRANSVPMVSSTCRLIKRDRYTGERKTNRWSSSALWYFIIVKRYFVKSYHWQIFFRCPQMYPAALVIVILDEDYSPSRKRQKYDQDAKRVNWCVKCLLWQLPLGIAHFWFDFPVYLLSVLQDYFIFSEYCLVFYSVVSQLVESALAKKPGGDSIVEEYNRTKGLTDSSRRQMVNILAADMTETHG